MSKFVNGFLACVLVGAVLFYGSGMLPPLDTGNMVPRVIFQAFASKGLLGHGPVFSLFIVAIVVLCGVLLARRAFRLNPVSRDSMFSRMGSALWTVCSALFSAFMCAYLYHGLRMGGVTCMLTCSKSQMSSLSPEDQVVYESLSAPAFWINFIGLSFFAVVGVAMTLWCARQYRFWARSAEEA